MTTVKPKTMASSKRWLHPTINPVEAEHLLKEQGVPGSFLARPSHNNPGDFTLSVRRETGVTHIKIQAQGEYYDLYGGEKFATLQELVEYYIENGGQLREKNGEVIHLKYPMNCAVPTERWFHGHLSGPEAEVLLEKAKNGTFLVRNSHGKPSNYSISVKNGDQVTHVRIQCNPTTKKYDVHGGKQFDSLQELVEYYKKNPMVEMKGSVVHLNNPCNATKVTANGLIDRVNKLHRESANNSNGLNTINASTSLMSLAPGDNESLPPPTPNSVMGFGFPASGGSSGFPPGTPSAASVASVSTANLGTIGRWAAAGAAAQNSAGFYEEFESLQSHECKHFFPRKEGLRPENKHKNRHKNILPFDHTRVILKTCDKGAGSDYINANHILPEDIKAVTSSTSSGKSGTTEGGGGNLDLLSNLSKKSKRYIATQGPVTATIGHFWQMVWQEGTHVIVNTTKEVEKSRQKCVRYWPDLHKTETHGLYRTQCVKETVNHDYKVREILLWKLTQRQAPAETESEYSDTYSDTANSSGGKGDGGKSSLVATGEPRRVFHFHFQAWPDHGIPEEPGKFIQFLHDVNEKQREVVSKGWKSSGSEVTCGMTTDAEVTQPPIVVHCSAGIGRTGTFIVIDMIFDQIQELGIDCLEIDIQRTILVVRNQRSGLVQTEQQYRFVYIAVSNHIETLQQRIYEKKKTTREYTNIKYSGSEVVGLGAPPHNNNNHGGGGGPVTSTMRSRAGTGSNTHHTNRNPPTIDNPQMPRPPADWPSIASLPTSAGPPPLGNPLNLDCGPPPACAPPLPPKGDTSLS